MHNFITSNVSRDDKKNPIPDGELETRTHSDQRISKLTGDGDTDGDGDTPNPQPWARPRYILIYKNNENIY